MGIVTRGVNIIAIAILTIIPIKHALADPLSEAIAAERRVDCPTAHRLYRALASSGNAEAYKRLGCVSAWGLDADRRRGHPSRINKISTLEPRVRRLRGQSSISIHRRFAASPSPACRRVNGAAYAPPMQSSLLHEDSSDGSRPKPCSAIRRHHRDVVLAL
jgi:hypothetical protein